MYNQFMLYVTNIFINVT